jgi:hypothetical protein
MSLKFTPEQFDKYQFTKVSIASRAQALFDAWLEAQPAVFGYQSMSSDPIIGWYPREGEPCGDTHRARLVCIEEIEKKAKLFPEMKANPDCPDNELWFTLGYRLIGKMKYIEGEWKWEEA